MNNNRGCFMLTVLLFISSWSMAQQRVVLYPDSVPNDKKSAPLASLTNNSTGIIYRVDTPHLEVYIPVKSKANGAAVIICPGGAYKVLTYQAEGVRTAKEFVEKGIAAFVLKYRLPNDSTMIDKKIGPLQDAQQAIRLVRERALQWGIDTGKIGLMGFSAGGHLAATAATLSLPVIENARHTNLKPNYLILVYPVISMGNTLTHFDSRRNLLGKDPSPEDIERFSMELQVTAHTPVTYLTHASDDNVVDVDNSIVFYESLRRHHIPAELHLYPTGGHGFVLRLPSEKWMAPLFAWMESSHIIQKL